MKKISLLILIIAMFFTTQVKAVEKGDFHMNITTNLGHHSFIGNDSFTQDKKDYAYKFVAGVTVNMDYAVSPYFSLGGWFTFAGKQKDPIFKYRYFGIGMRGNFHLYQLISEKGNAKLDADKFDVYIPLAIGGGFQLKDKVNGHKFRGGAIVGSGIGVTYYFVEHIGATLETGYNEASYAKIGLSFKF